MKLVNIIFLFFCVNNNCFSIDQKTIDRGKIYFSIIDPTLGYEKEFKMFKSSFMFYFSVSMGNRLNNSVLNGNKYSIIVPNYKTSDISPYYLFGIKFYLPTTSKNDKIRPYFAISDDGIGVGSIFRNDSKFYIGAGALYDLNDRFSILFARHIGFRISHRNYVINAGDRYIYTIPLSQFSLRYYLGKNE